tara:strand:+ start:1760 stop:2002 length:243 start_codon:yes stop_codon:yes gene_type:complete
MFKKNNEEKKLKKIFQWEQYLNWKKMSPQQKINFKRACLFPLLAVIVFNFLREFTYAILLIISFYLLLRFFKRRKISKKY